MSDNVLIPVVDERDNLITYKPRSALVEGDIGRITSLWVTNDKGEILIAQRAWKKKHHPGLWSSAVAGTVEQGETYESNIQKEAEEEIGLFGVELRPVTKFYYPSQKPFICMVFHAVVNQPVGYFRCQTEEVEQIVWVPYVQLKQDFQQYPKKYVPSFAALLNEIKVLYPGV